MSERTKYREDLLIFYDTGVMGYKNMAFIQNFITVIKSASDVKFYFTILFNYYSNNLMF